MVLRHKAQKEIQQPGEAGEDEAGNAGEVKQGGPKKALLCLWGAIADHLLPPLVKKQGGLPVYPMLNLQKTAYGLT